MKIHSDTLTSIEVYRATDAAGMRNVSLERCDRHGSRSRDHSYDVSLRGNSTRRPNPGTGRREFYDDEYAATWDEWGMFIEAIYLADPKALVGQYGEWSNFRAATHHRFTNLVAADACPNHVWKGTGEVWVSECSKCGAINDYGAMVAISIAKREAKQKLTA